MVQQDVLINIVLTSYGVLLGVLRVPPSPI